MQGTGVRPRKIVYLTWNVHDRQAVEMQIGRRNISSSRSSSPEHSRKPVESLCPSSSLLVHWWNRYTQKLDSYDIISWRSTAGSCIELVDGRQTRDIKGRVHLNVPSMNKHILQLSTDWLYVVEFVVLRNRLISNYEPATGAHTNSAFHTIPITDFKKKWASNVVGSTGGTGRTVPQAQRLSWETPPFKSPGRAKRGTFINWQGTR